MTENEHDGISVPLITEFSINSSITIPVLYMPDETVQYPADVIMILSGIPDHKITRQYIIFEDEELDICRHCEDGIIKTYMESSAVDPDDATLYEVRRCNTCGETE